jgi:hypothetical protein
MIQPLFEEGAQLQVFMKQLRVVFFRVPFGIPGLDDPEPEPYRIYFLTQNFTSETVLAYFFSARTTVMWLVGFLILLARPMARGVKRFRTVPPSTKMVLT